MPDEVKVVVVDPTTQEYMPRAIVRHSESTIKEPNFQVFLSCRCVACRMIREETSDQKNSCQPCVTAMLLTGQSDENQKLLLNQPNPKHHLLLVEKKNFVQLSKLQDLSASSSRIV